MARKTVQSPKFLVTSSAVVPSENTFQPNSWFTWLSIWNHSTADSPFSLGPSQAAVLRVFNPFPQQVTGHRTMVTAAVQN
jgi:hypothetical protein